MSVARIDTSNLTTNGNGSAEKMQEALHLPRHLPWRLRLRDGFRRSFLGREWEHVVVNKQIDSITMPKWIAVAVLGTVLTFGVQSWWARSADHDTLVEIKTELKLAKEANKEKEETLNGAIRDLNAWKEVMNGNQKLVIGMLSAQERDVLDKQKKPAQN